MFRNPLESGYQVASRLRPPGLTYLAVFTNLMDAYKWIEENQIKFPGTVLEVRNPRGTASRHTWAVVDAVEEKMLLDRHAEVLRHCEGLRALVQEPRQLWHLRRATNSRGSKNPTTALSPGLSSVVEMVKDMKAGRHVLDGFDGDFAGGYVSNSEDEVLDA